MTFAARVQAALEACEARGVTMRPYQRARSPEEQARLWRQSRSAAEIVRQLDRMRQAGAEWLADVLAGVGPQSGRHVTGAPPGLSWHQHDLAVDAFWLVDGRASWSTRRKVGGLNGYAVWREEAQSAGLYRGPVSDWPHVQGVEAGSPLRVQTWAEIDDAMRARWGG